MWNRSTGNSWPSSFLEFSSYGTSCDKSQYQWSGPISYRCAIWSHICAWFHICNQISYWLPQCYFGIAFYFFFLFKFFLSFFKFCKLIFYIWVSNGDRNHSKWRLNLIYCSSNWILILFLINLILLSNLQFISNFGFNFIITI